MKDVIKGYWQMMSGLRALIMCYPGLVIIVIVLTFLIKWLYKIVLWIW